METFAFIALAGLLMTTANAAPPASSQRTKEQEVRRTLDKIKVECGITTGQFSYNSKGISLVYDGMIESEKLECADQLTILVGADFKSYDTSAPYSGPPRFILKAPAARLAMVEKEISSSADWKIVHRADAGDGIAYLEIEAASGVSRANVRKLLDRFVAGDLDDVAIGLAPRTIFGHDKPSTDAVFRKAGRSMYSAIKNKSCGPPPEFHRDELIAAEREVIVGLETELAGTLAGSQLSVAKQDAQFIKPACWADDDIRFAQKHLEWDKNAINGGARTMRKLAPTLTGTAAHLPKDAALFRKGVRSIVAFLDPKCSLTSKGSDEVVLAAANAELARFELRLRGTPYADQFRIAKEDTEYDRARLVAECDEPDPTPVATLSRQALDHVTGEIRTLEQISHSVE